MDLNGNLTRRSLMKGGLAAAPLSAQSTSRPPNIVFLISDDHSVPDLGCYGNRSIRTPNLDRLASEGMRFNQCFVASPQCSPNRSAIFTGCTPHTTSTSRLHTPMPPWERSFLEDLQEKNYFVGAFRKVHQGDQFDKRWDFYGAKDVPFTRFFDEAPRDRPFFLHVGFTDPHRPYREGAVTPPHDPARVRVPNYLPDTPEVRKDLAMYADAISRMDSECGEVLALLKERGLEDNTLVVFTGDNGMPFPGAKGTCYDPGIQVPLLVRWPGRVEAGVVRDDLIAHVDLPATWLDAAGVPKPGKMQGRSFLNLLLGREYKPREAVFAERNWHDNFDPIRAVRTVRYKLIFNAAPHFPYRPAWDLADSPTWASYQAAARRGKLKPELLRLLQPDRPIVEMYDILKDPDEFHNVATDPAYSQARNHLFELIGKWMSETYDYLPPAASRPGEPPGRDWPLSL